MHYPLIARRVSSTSMRIRSSTVGFEVQEDGGVQHLIEIAELGHDLHRSAGSVPEATEQQCRDGRHEPRRDVRAEGCDADVDAFHPYRDAIESSVMCSMTMKSTPLSGRPQSRHGRRRAWTLWDGMVRGHGPDPGSAAEGRCRSPFRRFIPMLANHLCRARGNAAVRGGADL